MSNHVALEAATASETRAVTDPALDHVPCVPPREPPKGVAAATFTSFQYIAYRAPTLDPPKEDAYKPDDTSVIGRRLGSAADYKGSVAPAHVAEQIKAARALLQRMAAVLDVAKNLREIDRTATTLKVFVAPEFYFKGWWGKDHPWGSFEFNMMLNMLEELKRIGVPGPDWLVIPGSIVFYLPDGLPGYFKFEKDGSQSRILPGESVYANVAPVISAGRLTYVLKHEVSTVDGPPPDRAALRSDYFKPVVESWREKKSRFIMVGGRTIGLEVCLDHAQGELAAAITEYRGNERADPPPIDLHVITACGMEIHPAQARARANGYVMLCDGQGFGQPRGCGSRLMQADGSDVAPIATVDLPAALVAASPQKSPRQSIAVYPVQRLPR